MWGGVRFAPARLRRGKGGVGGGWGGGGGEGGRGKGGGGKGGGGGGGGGVFGGGGGGWCGGGGGGAGGGWFCLARALGIVAPCCAVLRGVAGRGHAHPAGEGFLRGWGHGTNTFTRMRVLPITSGGARWGGAGRTRTGG